VVNNTNVAGDTISSSTADRPDVIGNPSGPQTLTEWFNTAAFAVQPKGTVGDEERNMLYGPHFKHVDLSLFKDFSLGESRRIQFRAECFNISNTPSFASPADTLGNPGFGQITGLNVNYAPREFQFVLKYLF
jgi:hypothetical protein